MTDGAIELVIAGAGGFGREVLDIIEVLIELDEPYRFLGFLDDGEPNRDRLARRGAALLGPSTALPPGARYVIGIGDPRTRQQLDTVLGLSGRAAPPLVHPSVTIGSLVELGDGAVVNAGARLATCVQAGRHLHCNLNATLGHDSVYGDFVTVHPGVTISGGVTVGHQVMIGTGANILPGIVIGDDARIGAGAVVTADVAPGTTVVGIPARPLRVQH